jgi:hypothetical protein
LHDNDSDKIARAVVCKVVPASSAIMPPHDIRREIGILKKINHPNVSCSVSLQFATLTLAS